MFGYNSNARGSSVRMSVGLILASAASAAAFAQNPPTEEPAPQEVIVTGSRIPAPNLESTSPIQVVTSQDIQLGGRMDISDVINQLPQNFSNTLGQDLGNQTSGLTTAGGVSTADLRGLGPNRTLVLVNGRRLGIGSPYTVIQSPAPNLDQIPTFLLDRVDVVTGGASAVYGSDAIAGVINFVTKQNFEGFQIDYHIGQNAYKNDSDLMHRLVSEFGGTSPSGTSYDGRTQTINLMAGTAIADGAGNLTAYFSYHQADPVASSDRDFGGCQLVYDKTANQPACTGSANSNFFATNVNNPFAVVGNEFVPLGSVDSNPPALFNSQPFIFMSRDDQRYMAGFMGHVDLADAAKPYIEFHFMKDQTTQSIAPSALFIQQNPNDPAGNGNYNINCSNPFLSAQQQGVLGCTSAMIAADAAALAPGGSGVPVTVNTFIGRRNIEGGGRVSEYEHTSYRAVGGLKGDFANAWSYDAYAQFYSVDFFNANNKYLNYANIDKALIVTRDGAGNPVCASGGGCVPYNIFQDGGVTQDAVNYLSLNGTAQGTSTMRTIHADITGDLGQYGVKLPTANDALALNFGYERRQEDLDFAPDSAEQSGQLAGFGGAPAAIDVSQTVDEQFIEVRVPLMQDRPGVRDLIFDTGFRHSDYSVTGKINTHKFELQYAPIADFRFRGSFQRAIRAPSLIELFNPQAIGLIQFGTDPCAPTDGGTTAPAATAEQCARTGLDPALYAGGIPQTISGQITQLAGGQVNLEAETSKSYTLGLTFTPTFLPNFTGSLDYFNIDLKGGIGVFPANVIMTNCLQTGDPQFCSQIVRNPANGSLNGPTQQTGGYIIQTATNIGKTLLNGVDVQANYRLPMGDLGNLTFNLNGAYLNKAETTVAPGVVPYDCAGLFGAVCQTVNPKWHHNFRASWEMRGKLTVSAMWRYLGKVELDQNQDNPTLHFATFSQFNFFNAEIPAFHYLDLAGSYAFRDDVSLRIGVNNVFDKNPPLVTSEITAGGAANTYSVYDQLGRQAFAAVSVKF